MLHAACRPDFVLHLDAKYHISIGSSMRIKSYIQGCTTIRARVDVEQVCAEDEGGSARGAE